MSSNSSNVKLRVAFQTPNEIGSLFPFKDQVNDSSKRSRVVYRHKCNDCNDSYIGKTERILAYILKEHEGIDQHSAIHDHLTKNSSHTFNLWKYQKKLVTTISFS